MKNRLCIMLAVLLLAAAGCKKDKDMVSQVVDVSYPTITINGVSVTGVSNEDYFTENIDVHNTGYVSIAPGGSLNVSAYDSLYGVSIEPTAYGDQDFDPNTPGVYYLDYIAKNQYGFVTLARFVVNVSATPASIDLSGSYYGIIDGDTMASGIEIERLAAGLYRHYDVTGDSTGITGVFIHHPDNTIEFYPQFDQSYQLESSFSSLNGTANLSGAKAEISFEIDNEEIDAAYGEGTVFRFVQM